MFCNSKLIDFAKRSYVGCFIFLVAARQELSNHRGFLGVKVMETLIWRFRWKENKHLLFPCSEGDLEMETPLRKMLGDFGRPRPPSSTTPALLSSPESQFRRVMIREVTCCRAFNLDCESVRLPFAFLGGRQSRSSRNCS